MIDENPFTTHVIAYKNMNIHYVQNHVFIYYCTVLEPNLICLTLCY